MNFQSLIIFGVFNFVAIPSLWANCSLNIQEVNRESIAGHTFIEFALNNSAEAFKYDHELSDKITEFQNWISGQSFADPMTLILRQKFRWETAGVSTMSNRFKLILSGSASRLESLSCLEVYLFDLHWQNQNFQSVTELGAYVTMSPDKQLAKVYFASSTGPYVPVNQYKNNLVSDMGQGWSLKYNIHSHPYFFDNAANDIAGTLIPSGTRDSGDISVFLRERDEFQLQEARITNGFYTVAIPAENFEQFLN